MATTSIIADGATELASSDFTLAAGESTTLSLRGRSGNAVVRVQFKDSTGAYVDFGEINAQNSVRVLSGIGTYRCLRKASAVSFGVDRS